MKKTLTKEEVKAYDEKIRGFMTQVDKIRHDQSGQIDFKKLHEIHEELLKFVNEMKLPHDYLVLSKVFPRRIKNWYGKDEWYRVTQDPELAKKSIIDTTMRNNIDWCKALECNKEYKKLRKMLSEAGKLKETLNDQNLAESVLLAYAEGRLNESTRDTIYLAILFSAVIGAAIIGGKPKKDAVKVNGPKFEDGPDPDHPERDVYVTHMNPDGSVESKWLTSEEAIDDYTNIFTDEIMNN